MSVEDMALAWPHIRGLWPAAYGWHSAEGCTRHPQCRVWDTEHATDGWIMAPEYTVGYAIRAQPTRYDTFTVRSGLPSGGRTELDKIRATNGPRFHIQTYGRAVTGVVPTRDLVAAIDAGMGVVKSNSQDGNAFICVAWDALSTMRRIYWDSQAITLNI